MCSKSLIKRIAPFFLTFALGIFIASLFVPVSAPSFNFNRGFNRHREYHRRIETENMRLRDQNAQLQKRLAELEGRSSQMMHDFAVPPPPPVPVREMPMESVPYTGRVK